MSLRVRSVGRRAVALCAVAVLAAVSPAFGSTARAAASAAGPDYVDFATAFSYSLLVAPEADTPGANDFSCRPTIAHPRPVVLVHGTFENRYDNFARMAPAIKQAGYCVFALNYGDDAASLPGFAPSLKGTGDIRQSAKELATFVNRVLAATGAHTVDIVGHSQGGLMPRQYMKFEGGANKVHTLITLGATHHGTTLDGIATLADALGLLPFSDPLISTAARQQVRGSDFLRQLNADGDTVPGVQYLVIATRYDEVTTPYESTFLTAGPGATVQNVTLQDGCPIDGSDHLSMSYSPRAISYVLRGLGTPVPVLCLPNAPVL